MYWDLEFGPTYSCYQYEKSGVWGHIRKTKVALWWPQCNYYMTKMAWSLELVLMNTLLPQYNAVRYNAILDKTLSFLGSQIIFKKYLWGSVEVNSPIFAHIAIENTVFI